MHELHTPKNKSKNPTKIPFVTRSKNLFKNPNSLNPLIPSYQSAILNLQAHFHFPKLLYLKDTELLSCYRDLNSGKKPHPAFTISQSLKTVQLWTNEFCRPYFKGLLTLILHAAHQELGGRHQDGILDFCKHVLYSLPLGKAPLPAQRRLTDGYLSCFEQTSSPKCYQWEKESGYLRDW